MRERELTEFIVSRLAELSVVIAEDYIGRDEIGLEQRSEARDILVGLANYAMKHGRPDLAQILSSLAFKIGTSHRA